MGPPGSDMGHPTGSATKKNISEMKYRLAKKTQSCPDFHPIRQPTRIINKQILKAAVNET